MNKSLRFLILTFLCFLTTWTFGQASLSSYSTYELEVLPFRTQYGNILTEKDIKLNFTQLTRVPENGDVYIRVKFINGLKSNYLLQTAIPGTGFAYRVDYRAPLYQVSIINQSGKLLLQKIYGGEKKNALYGETESISSVEDLKFEWEANRDVFYANLESAPEEPLTKEMDEEFKMAVLQSGTGTGETPVAVNISPQTEPTPPTETRKKPPSKGNKKPNINIYRREEPNKTKIEDPSEPKLSTTSEQIFDLNGFIRVDACSKYSYQLENLHPYATFTISLQNRPEDEPEEIILGAGEVKFIRSIPHKQAWIKTTYEKPDFQGDLIDQKEQLNAISMTDDNPRIITNLLDQFFTSIKPQVIFEPKFSAETDEVIDYVSADDTWQNQLKEFLTKQTSTSLTKGEQNKIAKQTEQLMAVKALRSISDRVEKNLDEESGQKLIYSFIKESRNFRNVTPFIAFEYSQSMFLDQGISDSWNKQRAHRASVSFRLPFEWQLNKRKSGAFHTLNIKAGYESIILDYNQGLKQAYAVDPESNFMEPERVLDGDEFAIQATQLSAGLAWKLYFPLPIVELEAGAFYSHKTRLLWGESKGQFPRSLFSPENEIITDVADLSSFRPYFGAKIGIPFYFSGYKFGCGSNLRNFHLFAGIRMYPIDFSKNDNYKVFIKDAADIDFIPIPLDGKSKFLTHLMIGGAVEF